MDFDEMTRRFAVLRQDKHLIGYWTSAWTIAKRVDYHYESDASMNQDRFLAPRLVGARFDQHSLPLEILKDFAVFEEMLLEVSKWQFLASNPDRKRIPRGFSSGLELDLSEIEGGSAIAVISFVASALFANPNATYFEQARNHIIEAVASADQGTTPALPPFLLSYFDRLGRSLHEGEYIEFNRQGGSVAKLGLATRKRLIYASQAQKWTEDMSLKGRISAMDKGCMSFDLELKDGTRLKAPLSEQHLAAVESALSAYPVLRVQRRGVVKKDRQDHFKSLETVEHMTQLDPLDVESRLEELAELNPGWLDGKGLALDRNSLQMLARDFENCFDPTLPLPYLYPTAEGGVQAEWSINQWEISLEIDLRQRSAQYQALFLPDQHTEEALFNLADQADWLLLSSALGAILAQQA
jgi:hypothetical protein